MDLQKYKEHIYLWAIIFSIVGGISLGLFELSSLKDKYYFNVLSQNVIDKNLTILDEKNILGKYISDYDLETYSNYVINNYHYEKGTYDCKYYSLLWALYLEKHHMKYKFVTTDNHIFVITYHDQGYCVLDLNNVECKIANGNF